MYVGLIQSAGQTCLQQEGDSAADLTREQVARSELRSVENSRFEKTVGSRSAQKYTMV